MKPAGGPIDWDGVHARLDRLRAEADAALNPTPDRARAILEERAKALARVPDRTPGAGETLDVATFRLGDESYAIEARFVRRIVPLGDWTPIPGAPEFLLGVINSRGEVLAVVALGRLLGAADRPPTGSARVLIVGDDRDELGLLADSAEEFATLRIDAIHEPPGALEGAGRRYVRGVTAGALVVLDGGAILRDDRLIVDQGEEVGA